MVKRGVVAGVGGNVGAIREGIHGEVLSRLEIAQAADGAVCDMGVAAGRKVEIASYRQLVQVGIAAGLQAGVAADLGRPRRQIAAGGALEVGTGQRGAQRHRGARGQRTVGARIQCGCHQVVAGVSHKVSGGIHLLKLHVVGGVQGCRTRLYLRQGRHIQVAAGIGLERTVGEHDMSKRGVSAGTGSDVVATGKGIHRQILAGDEVAQRGDGTRSYMGIATGIKAETATNGQLREVGIGIRMHGSISTGGQPVADDGTCIDVGFTACGKAGVVQVMVDIDLHVALRRGQGRDGDIAEGMQVDVAVMADATERIHIHHQRQGHRANIVQCLDGGTAAFAGGEIDRIAIAQDLPCRGGHRNGRAAGRIADHMTQLHVVDRQQRRRTARLHRAAGIHDQ